MPTLYASFLPEQLTSEDGVMFITSLANAERWATIPLLNYTPLHELKDMSIVRFRGMIQDMQDPEMYLERYEVLGEDDKFSRIQEGKYRDCLVLKDGEHVNYDALGNIQGERRTFFVISIPGLNDWCQEYETHCNSCNIPAETLKGVGDDSGRKRAAPIEDSCMDVDLDMSLADCDTIKRMRTEESKSSTSVSTSSKSSSHISNSVIGVEYHLNSPIPSRPSKACMIKIYSDFEKYKLNTLVDVVGFLSVNPALDASTMDVDAFDNACEIEALNPPPSLIPRLHAIAVCCLPHPNPLLDERFLCPVNDKAERETCGQSNLLSVGNEFRNFLKLCLFNDEVAAHYLLSHLISSVYCRAELRCLGRFILNLCNLPQNLMPEYTKIMYDLLALIIPASHYIKMTADTLNDSCFGPKKDYETNKLVSGMLQLAPQTHLVIDESYTMIAPLNSNGILSRQILEHVMMHQQLKCNFQYYEIEYEVDIPVLCFSDKKSVFTYDAIVPVEYDDQSIDVWKESLKAARHYLNPKRLNQFRRFLTTAKLVDFSVNPEESEMVQNDFVEMRKNKSIRGAEELHHLLVLSRLLAVAHGKKALDKNFWELAKRMEATRYKRLQAHDKVRQRIT